MNNDLINELYSKIDNQEKIIVDLQKNNSGITLEEHVRVLNAYQELQEKYNKQKEVIDKAIEYINKYAWQEDIIGGIYTTNGKPATDRYMKLEWDNCNELLDILKGND